MCVWMTKQTHVPASEIGRARGEPVTVVERNVFLTVEPAPPNSTAPVRGKDVVADADTDAVVRTATGGGCGRVVKLRL
jgi:hypothetical protein